LSTVTEHQRIIGFRNILIHGYDIVDERIVWNAIESHLPLLTREIQASGAKRFAYCRPT